MPRRSISALLSTCVLGATALLLLSAGCSGTASVVMADRIRPGNGYALIVVHTNWKPYEMGFERLQLAYAPRGDGRMGKVRVRRGGELELVELPAGDYQWQEVKLGQQVVAMSADSGFRVIEGEINYIGDVHATYDESLGRLVQLEVRDNAVEVSRRAHAANAALLQRYALRTDQLMRLEASFDGETTAP